MTDVDKSNAQAPVAVLGLGSMGVAMAHALRVAGHPLRLWNRTERSPDDLGRVGLVAGDDVTIARSPAAAVVDAEAVVLCLRDHRASRDVVERLGPELGQGVVLNVSTGTPAETVASAGRAAALGMRYVTGAIMVPTPMVGTDDFFAICAGAEPDLAVLAPVLAALGGSADLVGDDHAVPAALDLAMLDIYFAGIYAHLHATALVGAHGIEAQRFLPYARSVVGTLDASLAGLTSAAEQRRYDTGEAGLDMCLSFLDHIVSSSRAAGIDPAQAKLIRDATARAATRWAGDTDWDVVFEQFVQRPGQ